MEDERYAIRVLEKEYRRLIEKSKKLMFEKKKEELKYNVMLVEKESLEKLIEKLQQKVENKKES